MGHLGHKAVKVLLEAGSVQELDEAMKNINDCYSIIREQVKAMEEIKVWRISLLKKECSGLSSG